MQLGYDARHVRWKGRGSFGEPGLEDVLLALVEQASPVVVRALRSVGTDVPALQAELTDLRARHLHDRDRNWHARRQVVGAVFSERGPEQARLMKSDILHAEHLLLGIADRPGDLQGLLRGHRVSHAGLLQALRQSSKTRVQVQDTEWRDRFVREAWYRCMTLTDPVRTGALLQTQAWERYPVGDGRLLGTFREELCEAGDFELLGRFYEALGTANLLFVNPLYLPGRHDAFFWLNGAHFYRLAGETERAAELARRTEQRLRTIIAAHEPWTEETENWNPFYLELMGDAAVCFDPEKAREYYQQALAAFQRLGPGEAWAEADNAYGFGGILHDQVWCFLPLLRGLDHQEEGVRIPLKMKHWLG